MARAYVQLDAARGHADLFIVAQIINLPCRAVSPNCIRLTVRLTGTGRIFERSADYKSAKRQSATLRYAFKPPSRLERRNFQPTVNRYGHAAYTTTQ